MGQFESLVNQPSHEMPASGRPQHLDFNSILGDSNDKPAQAQPAQPARSQAIDINQVARSNQAPASTYSPVDGQQDTPPRPDPVESSGNKLGWWLTNGAALGAGGIAVDRLAKSLRATEVDDFTMLESVVKPESLAAVQQETAAVVKTVAEKSRAAAADVDSIATFKPHAFEEIAEQMPAKQAGQPPSQLVFRRPKADTVVAEESAETAAEGAMPSLTPAEANVVDRATYLRNLERRLVSNWNMENTSTVNALRTRQPYLVDLGKNEFAEAEGLAAPLNKLESMSGHLLGETTAGRTALHHEVTGKIMTAAAEIGGSFLATRAIDSAIYGGKSQGLLTTCFDVAAPFVTLTKMSTVAKIGIMIGGHELARATEYLSAKHKEETENGSSN